MLSVPEQSMFQQRPNESPVVIAMIPDVWAKFTEAIAGLTLHEEMVS
jgi:hypothetical protein